MTKKIFILVGHPDSQSFNTLLADAYEKGAKEVGNEVKKLNLGDLKFDPILHQGYKVIQELEPDLIQIQENIKWSEHFVIFYPSWWSTMPALLKGMFDRIWLPGFAFHFNKKGSHSFGWQKLLKGGTARVFVSSDSHPWLSRILFGDSVNEIKKGILSFAGFKTKVKKIGPIKNISPAQKQKWLTKMQKWGSESY